MAGEVNVGAIAVEILARTEKLEKGMKTASTAVNAFGGMIAGATAAVVNFGLSAATGAVSALGGLVAKSFETIGATQDLAITLNTSTQALQGLAYAAKNTGADAGSLNAAMSKLNLNIGKAIAGDKAAIEGFDALGIKFQDLAGMGTDEALKLVADQIAKLPTPAQQANAAIDLFGKSASNLIPLLASGSAGIQELQDRYAELSGGMSELDVSKVQLAGDLMDDLMVVVKGVADQIAVNLAPFIIYASKKLIELGFNGEGAINAVGTAFEWLKGVMQNVATITTWLQRGWMSFRLIFEILERAVVSWFASVESSFNWLSEKIKEWTGEDLGTSTFFSSWRQQSDAAIDETITGINELTNALDNNEPARKMGAWFDGVKAGAEEAAKEITDLALKRREIAREAGRTMEREIEEKKPKEAAAKINSNSFRSIDTNLISASALGRGNVEEKQLKQLEQQTAALNQINQGIQKITGVAVAG